jgi:hypothetical protein
MTQQLLDDITEQAKVHFYGYVNAHVPGRMLQEKDKDWETISPNEKLHWIRVALRLNSEYDVQTVPSRAWPRGLWGYTHLFESIGRAVEWRENKIFGISVKAFEDAMTEYTTSKESE